MEQHMYKCHTCMLNNKVYVCTSCAWICHNGHDLTYENKIKSICACASRGPPNCCKLRKPTEIKVNIVFHNKIYKLSYYILF